MKDQRRGLCEDEDEAGFDGRDGVQGRSALRRLREQKLRLRHYPAVHAGSLLTFQSLLTSEISFLSPQSPKGLGRHVR